MYIAKAAQRSGTTVKTIRHYEALGLLPVPPRQGSYRVYDQQSVERLMFIKCAQQLGFKLKELQALLPPDADSAFPWDIARRAIHDKQRQLSTQITTLTQLNERLEQFAAQLEAAQGECPQGSLAVRL